MIWLTWRRHRRMALIFGGVIALLAAYFVISGLVFYRAYEQVVGGVSVASCQRQPQPLCGPLISGFAQTYNPVAQFGLLGLAILPALVGMFLGAPLVARELEGGTFRLIWTQSVTRRRWLAVSCVAVMGGVALVCALFIPLAHWWGVPISQDFSLGTESYDFGGLIPIAYLLFALALGIAAGALLRRTVPAMFATFVGYLVVRFPIELWARPHLIPPLTALWDPSVASGPAHLSPNAWLLFDGFANRAGNAIYPPFDIYQTCAPTGGTDLAPGSPFTTCLHAHGWFSLMIWQPANHYWALQGIESAIFVALALGLLALTFWWVRARLS